MLVALFLASRLINLLALPIFVDEGMHISRAQRMLAAGNFLHETLAGKFLHIWLLIPIVTWTENPLIAARALSAVTGLASGITTFYLARLLWPRQKIGWIAALIYLILPLPLINERMALADSLLTALTTLILILSFKLIRQPCSAIGYALGVCLGLAYLTKLNGLIYLAIPIFSLILLKGWRQSAKILIQPYLVAFIVALPTVTEFPRQFLSVAVRGLPNPMGPQISTVTWWLYSLGETWLDLTAYVTWPILLLAAMRLLYGLRSREREAALFAVLLLLTPAIYALLGKDVWYSRYLLPIVPLLVVLAARTLADLASLLAQQTRLKHSKMWLVLLCLLALLPGMIFDHQLITNPSYAPFAPVDRWQYITGWPSGYGLAEAVTWLQQEAAEKGPLVVITGIHSGPTQEGLRLYLGNDEPDIRLFSVDLRSDSGEMLQQLVQTQTVPTLLLLNEPADRDPNPLASTCPTTLAVFPKPENKSRLVLKGCVAPQP
ncbi:MAG: phospholipid carrier-dependent glycosyltransferase [Anaerolineae bacterium]|nr:phospholipid carrier-dependent glycosyltransferase [Anaerolineae bacterium]